MRLVIFLFVYCFIHAKDSSSPQPIFLKELHSSTIVDGVHVISGQFVKAMIDYSIPAPQPIEIRRSYCNSKFGDGFHILSYADAIIFEDRNAIETIACEDQWGSNYLFHKEKPFYCKGENPIYNLFISQGITNLGQGYISGQTNPLNTKVILDKNKKDKLGERFTECQTVAKYVAKFCDNELNLREGDGTNKIYILKGKKIGNIAHAFTTRIQDTGRGSQEVVGSLIYELDYERKANGNILKFDIPIEPQPIAFNNLCKKISSWDKEQRKNYCSIETDWKVDPKNKTATLTVHTSDDKEINYHYIIDDFSSSVFKKLARVDIPSKLPEEYEYKKSSNKVGYDLTTIKWPNNRFFKIKYYEKNQSYGVANHSFKITKHHPSLNKIYALEIPGTEKGERRAWRYFIYHPNDENDGIWEGGYTLVFDALGNSSKYQYDRSYKLTLIEKFDLNQNCIKKEAFFWDKDKHVNLVTKAILDQFNHIQAAIHYLYDKNYNPIEEQLFGCLSGEKVSSINIDKDGNPIQFSEIYKIYRTYSDDGLNLLLSEKDDFNKKITYLYKPGTNLLTGIFIWDQNQIKKRTFYNYNEDASQVLVIEDDGNSQDVNNLASVTRRLIKEIEPRSSQPALGQPETITHFYLDLSTLQKVLLQKEILIYDTNHQLTKKQTFDSNNQFAYETTTLYDTYGNIVKTIDPLANEVTNQYDENNNLIKTNSAKKNAWIEYGYDFANRKVYEKKVDGKCEQLTYYKYNNNDQLISIVDSNGNETMYDYDSQGRLICTIYPLVQDENGNIKHPLIKKAYDVFDNVISEQDARANTTEKKYTIYGQETEVVYPDQSKDHFSYYENGLLKQKFSKTGLTFTYKYDYQNRLIEKSTVDTKTGKEYRENKTYDAFNITSETDANGNTTTFTYDFANRLKEKKTFRSTIVYEYDRLSRVSKKSFYSDNTLQYVIKKEYDYLNRTTQKNWQDQNGNIQKQIIYEYDAMGNKSVIKTIGKDGTEVYKVVYDLLKRPLEVIDQENAITSYEYLITKNSLNQTVSQIIKIDPEGLKTITTFDAINRPIRIEKYKNHLLAQEEITYDLNGNISKRSQKTLDSNHAFVVHTDYDELNRPIQEIQAKNSPQEKKIQFSYNQEGFLIKKIKADSHYISYTYDGFGNQLTLQSSDKTINYSYEYDNNHNLKRIYDHKHLINEKRYDENNKVIQETLNNLTYKKNYDGLGRIISYTLPDGSKINYIYQGINLQSIKRASLDNFEKYIIKDLVYDSTGKLLSKPIIGTQKSIDFLYTKTGYSRSITTTNYREQVIYNKIGSPQRQKIQDPNHTYENTYEYDDLHQLKKEQGLFNHEFKHDSTYNTVQIDQFTYTIDSLNQLFPSSSEAQLTYDANGNLIYKKSATEEVTYQYDVLNRLIKIESPNHYILQFEYDGSYRRIKQKMEVFEQESYNALTSLLSTNDQKVQSKELLFLYNESEEIGSIENNNLKDLKIAHPQNQKILLALEIDNGVYTPLQDYRFNVIALIPYGKDYHDQTYYYSAFGKRISEDYYGKKVIAKSLYGYMTKRHIFNTALIAFGYRDYDTNLQRWITPDPAGFIDGLNLYAFVKNNPLALSDLKGLSSGNNLSRMLHIDYDQKDREQRIANYKESLKRPYLQFYFINGMGNVLADAKSNLFHLHNHGFQNTQLIYSPAGGFFDFGISILNHLAIPTKGVDNIMKALIDFDQKAKLKDKLAFITHSRGNMQLSIVLDIIRKSSKPEINKLIDRIAFILAIAPAKFITKDQFPNVHHVEASSDFVPKLMPFTSNRHFAFDEGTITIIPSKGQNIEVHSFQNEIYEKILNEIKMDLSSKFSIK